MSKLNLGHEGSFFSGRSRAEDIVAKFFNTSPSVPIVIDFSGVESATQSFISELLIALRNKGIKPSQVEFIGVKDKDIERRIHREIERLITLMAS